MSLLQRTMQEICHILVQDAAATRTPQNIGKKLLESLRERATVSGQIGLFKGPDALDAADVASVEIAERTDSRAPQLFYS